MIIGRDTMHSLGINLLFDTAEISWDNAKLHMHPEMLKGNWVDALEQEVLMHMIQIQQMQKESKVLLSQNTLLLTSLRLWKNVHT
jgi:hypothetical protein